MDREMRREKMLESKAKDAKAKEKKPVRVATGSKGSLPEQGGEVVPFTGEPSADMINSVNAKHIVSTPAPEPTFDESFVLAEEAFFESIDHVIHYFHSKIMEVVLMYKREHAVWHYLTIYFVENRTYRPAGGRA
jgi:hypothetical protein